jgi:uncharacterized protein (TIGR02466 family)
MNDNTQKKDGLRVLFPTLIYEAWYPEFSEREDDLVSYVETLRDKDKEGREISAQQYPSGYTSYFTNSTLFNDSKLEGLVKFLHQCAQNYAQDHHWDTANYHPEMNALFANINPKHSFHPEHLHPYSHISGVFYVKSDANSPAIGFKDPRMARWMMPPVADGKRAENSFHAKLAPEPGKLFLFPSWLEHGVAQNQSDRERISMSFNFEMRAKPQT